MKLLTLLTLGALLFSCGGKNEKSPKRLNNFLYENKPIKNALSSNLTIHSRNFDISLKPVSFDVNNGVLKFETIEDHVLLDLLEEEEIVITLSDFNLELNEDLTLEKVSLKKFLNIENFDENRTLEVKLSGEEKIKFLAQIPKIEIEHVSYRNYFNELKMIFFNKIENCEYGVEIKKECENKRVLRFNYNVESKLNFEDKAVMGWVFPHKRDGVVFRSLGSITYIKNNNRADFYTINSMVTKELEVIESEERSYEVGAIGIVKYLNGNPAYVMIGGGKIEGTRKQDFVQNKIYTHEFKTVRKQYYLEY